MRENPRYGVLGEAVTHREVSEFDGTEPTLDSK